MHCCSVHNSWEIIYLDIHQLILSSKNVIHLQMEFCSVLKKNEIMKLYKNWLNVKILCHLRKCRSRKTNTLYSVSYMNSRYGFWDFYAYIGIRLYRGQEKNRHKEVGRKRDMKDDVYTKHETWKHMNIILV